MHYLAGLINMLNCGATVQSFSSSASSGKSVDCSIGVRGCGTLVVHATSAPSSCTVDGSRVQADYSPEQQTLSIAVPQTDTLLSSVELSFSLW